MRQTPRRIVRIALIAALYAVLTAAPPFSSISYGPVQVRVSEALTVLPFLTRDAIAGLWIGCILANLGSPFLLYDVTLGAGATLLAAFLTSKMPSELAAPLPPVVLNSIVVSAYVSRLSAMPYVPVALNIAAGEAIACFALGYPLLRYVARNPGVRRLLEE